MTVIMDGKAVAAALRAEVKSQAEEYQRVRGKKAGLAVILVGDDPASAIYVKNKIKACEECGIKSFHYSLDASVTQDELLKLIDELNQNPDVQGILVQLPLPAHLNATTVTQAISPKKDVDGFCYENLGRLAAGSRGVCSCTPYGIMYLLKTYGIDPAGKNAVVIGRSNIVGKPISYMLTNADATVTLCHSKTRDLKSITQNADILVVAMKKTRYVTGDMIKPGAVVVDVGINRTESGIAGDVDFDSVNGIASYLTPVPGGVGPMTIASLMKNLIICANDQ